MGEENQETKVQVNLRLKLEARACLERLAGKFGISQAEVLERGVPQLEKWNILQPGWELQVADQYVQRTELKTEKKRELEELKSKKDIEKIGYHHDLAELSKERDRKHQFDLIAYKRLLDSLSEDEVRDMWEERLKERRALRGEELAALPESLSDGKIKIRINGWERVVEQLDANGFPIIADFQGELVKCANMFHVKGTTCKNCNAVSLCTTIRKERTGIA